MNTLSVVGWAFLIAGWTARLSEGGKQGLPFFVAAIVLFVASMIQAGIQIRAIRRDLQRLRARR